MLGKNEGDQEDDILLSVLKLLKEVFGHGICELGTVDNNFVIRQD